MKIVRNIFNTFKPNQLEANNSQVNINIKPATRTSEEGDVVDGYEYTVVMFDETECAHLPLDVLIEKALKYNIIERAGEVCGFDMDNTEMIKREANLQIIEKYPLYKQLNISSLLGYTQEDKTEMETFINAIRNISNTAIEQTTPYHLVEWL